MNEDIETVAWDSHSYQEKNTMLLLRQRRMLNMLLERKAITVEQYNDGIQHMEEKIEIADEAQG